MFPKSFKKYLGKRVCLRCSLSGYAEQWTINGVKTCAAIRVKHVRKGKTFRSCWYIERLA